MLLDVVEVIIVVEVLRFIIVGPSLWIPSLVFEHLFYVNNIPKCNIECGQIEANVNTKELQKLLIGGFL